jgi:hypothetical protein
MAENRPESPGYRKWFFRSLLLIGVGLIAVLCAPLLPPLQDFDPDFPTGLDNRERLALLGTIAVCAGLVIALVCGTIWLTIGVQSTVRRHRR